MIPIMIMLSLAFSCFWSIYLRILKLIYIFMNWYCSDMIYLKYRKKRTDIKSTVTFISFIENIGLSIARRKEGHFIGGLFERKSERSNAHGRNRQLYRVIKMRLFLSRLRIKRLPTLLHNLRWESRRRLAIRDFHFNFAARSSRPVTIRGAVPDEVQECTCTHLPGESVILYSIINAKIKIKTNTNYLDYTDEGR